MRCFYVASDGRRRLYRSGAYTPCVLAALIRKGLLRLAHLRRACHYALRHLRLYRSSAYTPCVLAALIRMGLLRLAHLRRACHHALRRRRCIVQTADSRQRRVTPRNPIRTTRSAEGAWGVGLHHRYALRRCSTSPEAEWSDIAARRVSNEFWDRHRCRTEK